MSDANALDPRKLTVSQAYGYEELPRPLKLEELSKEFRLKIWNLLYEHIRFEFEYGDLQIYDDEHLVNPWRNILRTLHVDFLERPIHALEEMNNRLELRRFVQEYYPFLMREPFSSVFNLLIMVVRHEECPKDFITSASSLFVTCRLAYVLDVQSPPTIYPAVTVEEGQALLQAAAELRSVGLTSAVTHLRLASDCVSQGNYAGAVRESIHSVESTARQFDPSAKTLEPALKALERTGALHPALKKAFSNLYGYTSDEQGIRHALIDNPQPNVGQDEAVFMLGACASFSSYLARNAIPQQPHVSLGSPR